MCLTSSEKVRGTWLLFNRDVSIQRIPKIFSLTLLDTGAILLYSMFAEQWCSYSVHLQWTTANSFLYCVFHPVKLYIRISYQFPKCLTQSGSFLWPAAGCLVSHVQCESQDPVPSVMLRYSANPSHLCVSSHAHRSAECRKRCPCRLSHRCQANKMNNKRGKWCAFFKTQIVVTKT